MSKRNGMISILKKTAWIGTSMLLLASGAYAQAVESPVVTDSRIKTFVYSENEVYKLVMHYGFQSHIVFDKNEVIETVSVGDSYAWKVTPVEDRIFVKPLEESSYTNMTVVTDKRTYQFDLVSKDPGEEPEDELVYMVRFYYPSGNFDMPHLAMQGGMQQNMTPMSPQAMSPMSPQPFTGSSSMQSPAPMSEPMPSMMGVPPVPQSTLNDYPSDDLPDYKGGGSASSSRANNGFENAGMNTSGAPAYNFNYTLTGPNGISPDRVFDDGMNTYFEFPANVKVPDIAMVTGSNEVPMSHNMQGGFVVVNGVGEKFSLRSGKDTVFVFNESI